MNLKRAYSLVLLLYPTEFRKLFGAQMLAAYEEASIVTDHDRTALLRFAFAELKGLLAGAAAEWAIRFSYQLCHSGEYTNDDGCLANPGLMLPPGIRRRYQSATGAALFGGLELLDEEGLCPNIRQLYAIASPIRRLVISVCQFCFPIHRNSISSTRDPA